MKRRWRPPRNATPTAIWRACKAAQRPGRIVRLTTVMIMSVLAAALVGSGTPRAEAQQADAAAIVTIETAYDNLYRAGAETPLHVRIQANRVIDGTVVVEYSTRRDEHVLRFTTPIETAANTTRQLTIVVPPLDAFGTEVTASLLEDHRPIASDTLDANRSTADFVGVMSSRAGDLPPDVPLVAEVGAAQLFPFEPDAIDDEPALLIDLDSLVMPASALESLGPATRDALLDWVFSGGTLLLEAPGVTLVGALPDTAQPGADRRADYGRGRILSIEPVVTIDDLTGTIPASSRPSMRVAHDTAMLTGDIAPFSLPLFHTIADDASAELFDLRWIGVLLGVYAVAAVPGVWWVARRRRHAWVICLALALVAMLAAWLVWLLGTNMTTGSDDAHATTIEIAPHGARVTTAHLVTSRNGGTRTVLLPPQWRTSDASTAVNDPRFGPMFGPPPGVHDDAELAPLLSAFDGRWISTDLDAGGSRLLYSQGPDAAYGAAISLEARVDADGTVRGTISNRLDIDVHQVGLFADLAGEYLGTIPAQGSLDFELDSRPRHPFNGRGPEGDVWPASFATNGPFPVPMAPANGADPDASRGDIDEPGDPTVVNAGLWADFVNGAAGSARPRGHLVAAAWTDELPPPLTDDAANGRTLLIARTVLRPIDTLTGLSMVAEIVRPSDETPREFEGTTAMGPGATWRYRAPAGSSPAERDMALVVPSHTALAIWIDDEWVEIGLDGRRATMRLPNEAFTGPGQSEIYLRLFHRQANGPIPGPGPRTLSVVEVSATMSPQPFITYADLIAQQALEAGERTDDEVDE